MKCLSDRQKRRLRQQVLRDLTDADNGVHMLRPPLLMIMNARLLMIKKIEILSPQPAATNSSFCLETPISNNDFDPDEQLDISAGENESNNSECLCGDYELNQADRDRDLRKWAV